MWYDFDTAEERQLLDLMNDTLALVQVMAWNSSVILNDAICLKSGIGNHR